MVAVGGYEFVFSFATVFSLWYSGSVYFLFVLILKLFLSVIGFIQNDLIQRIVYRKRHWSGCAQVIRRYSVASSSKQRNNYARINEM